MRTNPHFMFEYKTKNCFNMFLRSIFRECCLILCLRVYADPSQSQTLYTIVIWFYSPIVRIYILKMYIRIYNVCLWLYVLLYCKSRKHLFINSEYTRLINIKYTPDGRQRVIVSRLNGTHTHTHNNNKTNLSSRPSPL